MVGGALAVALSAARNSEGGALAADEKTVNAGRPAGMTRSASSLVCATVTLPARPQAKEPTIAAVKSLQLPPQSPTGSTSSAAPLVPPRSVTEALSPSNDA